MPGRILSRMKDESDEDIARRVQGGESAAFAELVDRYDAKLSRYARRFLLDPDDADDIVQDTFIKAYQNIQSFDTSRRFSPWVYRIAHNEFVNALKRRESRGIAFDIDIDTILPFVRAAESADQFALERDLREHIDANLAKIDAKYREPLILYYLEEMDYKEISDVLQIPVSTVGVRLARAKVALRKAAGPELSL